MSIVIDVHNITIPSIQTWWLLYQNAAYPMWSTHNSYNSPIPWASNSEVDSMPEGDIAIPESFSI